VLATQNPVDLDYRGLSNTGTWFLGRLQTERDKQRVLEGLEGASAAGGANFDRQRMEALLAGLRSRVFLMNNVHEDQPVVFQTRWALSFLRGPLTGPQIATLMADQKAAAAAAESAAAPTAGQTESLASEKPPLPATPLLPPDVDVYYLPPAKPAAASHRLVYRPALLGRGKLHFVRSSYQIDTWQTRTVLQPLGPEMADAVWQEAVAVSGDDLELETEAEPEGRFAQVPAGLSSAKKFATWARQLKGYLYSSQTLPLWRCAELKTYSAAGETERDFRIRLSQLAAEQRDAQVEKLRKKFAAKADTLRSRIVAAEAAVEREKSQAQRATLDSAVSFGATLLGALLGRKLISRTSVSRASTSVRSAGRAAQQRGDIARAEDKLAGLRDKLLQLEERFGADVDQLEEKYHADQLPLEPLSLRPRKSDIEVQRPAVVWTPWQVDPSGIAAPLYALPPAGD
ncbi:MAG: ATP-binding protein, partial [Planctomycetales bacterium]|nr:ATP-binding protein [Planctomycetales bacterium]